MRRALQEKVEEKPPWFMRLGKKLRNWQKARNWQNRRAIKDWLADYLIGYSEAPGNAKAIEQQIRPLLRTHHIEEVATLDRVPASELEKLVGLHKRLYKIYQFMYKFERRASKYGFRTRHYRKHPDTKVALQRVQNGLVFFNNALRAKKQDH